MFANEKFIEATRDFVCIRIETYENDESEKMVRSLLGGSFANTAFCVFDPDGRERLSRSGRGPNILAGRRSDGGVATTIREMAKIASRYEAVETGDALLQDFDTFRQALNVASADQRLLIVVSTGDKLAKQNLRSVLADESLVGRFHVDLVDEHDDSWSEAIQGDEDEPGFVIVRSGQFGLEGEVMQQLPKTASVEQLQRALSSSNDRFASLEERKDYAEHVTAGLREGIFFENEIPYGEDRDGDGEIDRQPRRRRD